MEAFVAFDFKVSTKERKVSVCVGNNLETPIGFFTDFKAETEKSFYGENVFISVCL